MRPLMVLGCTSNAGKSLIATAMCRWFTRHDVRVAPFKAQNMSNNSRVVAGGEIGVAQWLQARAACVEPDVRMNPVLIKPEADTQSQVVVRGRADLTISRTPWRDRHDLLWPAMSESFDDLRREFDLVVMEGAGSPAEINLRDQVNNRMVEFADASAILVSNIDAGGSFAHLFGTWSLVPDETRERLAGFVLNQFRGDGSLLAPGPQRLTELTTMCHLATVPMIDHDLPDEEGAIYRSRRSDAALRVGVLRFPFGSNLDEFHALAHATEVQLMSSVDELERCDVIVLPGSKHVVADLRWARERGLAEAVVRAARAGTRVIGVCGGAMMLGERIVDDVGVESPGTLPGLGVLPIRTTMQSDKIVAPTTVSWTGLPEPWAALDGLTTPGYEIRFGRIDGEQRVVTGSPNVWADGTVLATTVHGCFESSEMIAALTGVVALGDPVEATLERLADLVEETFDTEALLRLVES